MDQETRDAIKRVIKANGYSPSVMSQHHLSKVIGELRDAVKCKYCNELCPLDPDNCCDGYAGDIDGLYASEDDGLVGFKTEDIAEMTIDQCKRNLDVILGIDLNTVELDGPEDSVESWRNYLAARCDDISIARCQQVIDALRNPKEVPFLTIAMMLFRFSDEETEYLEESIIKEDCWNKYEQIRHHVREFKGSIARTQRFYDAFEEKRRNERSD